MAKAKPQNPTPTTPTPALGIDPGADVGDAPPADPLPAADAAPETPPKRGRQTAPPPECPYCHVPCKAGHSNPLFTRYYCPECSFSIKQQRPGAGRRIARQRREEEDFSAR